MWRGWYIGVPWEISNSICWRHAGWDLLRRTCTTVVKAWSLECGGVYEGILCGGVLKVSWSSTDHGGSVEHTYRGCTLNIDDPGYIMHRTYILKIFHYNSPVMSHIPFRGSLELVRRSDGCSRTRPWHDQSSNRFRWCRTGQRCRRRHNVELTAVPSYRTGGGVHHMISGLQRK